MTTRISLIEEADAWCRQLGNFAPIVYRPAVVPGASMQRIRSPFAGVVPVSRASTHMRAQRGRPAMQFLLAALIMAAMIYPLSGSAQMPGGGMGGGMGGHGGHGNHGNHPADAAPKKPDDAAAHAPGPLRAMLTEMRKLRADLLLTAQQLGPWSAMEDALRECVELDRSRMPVTQPGAAIDAQLYVQDLADNQHALADAAARFAAATKAAFAVLNPRQLQTSRDRLASAIAGEQTASAALP